MSDFLEQSRREFTAHGMKLQLVAADADFQYNIVIAQESTMGSAAASVVALDKKGILVASVVRSGRSQASPNFHQIHPESSAKLWQVRGSCVEKITP